MINPHMQFSTIGWPLVANTRASGGHGARKVTKLLFGAERAHEIYEGAVWYRWVGDQPLVVSEDHCERWLRQFVDGTFINNNARAITYLNEYNETLSNGQSDEEKEAWKLFHTNMAKVWKERFRDVYPELKHIKLVLCETSVGNDVHLAIAKAAVKYDAVIGYHPYIACNHKAPVVPDTTESGINRPSYVSPHDWRWYSGRWSWMDDFFVANGVRVQWAFGEMGPVLDASGNWSGWLDPIGGWKSCLGGSIERYKEVMRYWLDNATRTRAYHEDRIIGGVLFTSGAPSDGQWDTFELRDGNLRDVIEFTNNYPYPKKTGTFYPPPPVQPPPVQKPEPIPDGLPRVQYHRRMFVVPNTASLEQYLSICHQAFKEKRTVGFSYDDAGIGALENKTAILFGIDNDERQIFVDWFAKNYEGTKVEWGPMPEMANLPQVTLSEPVDDVYKISQMFGDNFEIYMQRYGIHGHNGIDYATPIGTQVFAAGRGTLRKVGYDANGYGHYVTIDHDSGLQTIYAHLSAVYTSIGLGGVVEEGDLIGLSGNSGWSSGPHLHFGVKYNNVYYDPRVFIGVK